MVECTIEYEGELHCKATHGPSGMSISTDAPKDNMGRGESFSPTDLVGTALASCILTTIGIVAPRHNIDLAGMRATVTKEMSATPPRRIARLVVNITMPGKFTDEQKQILERTAHTCPVHRSLHPDVEAPIIFHWE